MTAPITSTAESLEGQLQEILIALQNKERTAAMNPENRNFIQGTVNTDTMIFQGSFSLPVRAVVSPTNGRVTYIVVPYLLDPETEETEPTEG